MSIAENNSDETSNDFARPFKIATSTKKRMIASIDSKSNWPEAKFLRMPTTYEVFRFLHNQIALLRIEGELGEIRAAVPFGAVYSILPWTVGLLRILSARWEPLGKWENWKMH